MRYLNRPNLLVIALLFPLLFLHSLNGWFRAASLITCFWFLLTATSMGIKDLDKKNSSESFGKMLIAIFAYIILAKACLSIITSLSKIVDKNDGFVSRISGFSQLLNNHWNPLFNINWISISFNQYLPLYFLGVISMIVWLVKNDLAKLKKEGKVNGKESVEKFWGFIELFPLCVVGVLLYEAYSWISIQPQQIMPLSTSISDVSVALNNVTFFMQKITLPLVIFAVLFGVYTLYVNFGMASKYIKKLFILILMLYVFAFLYLDSGGTQLPANVDAYDLVKDNPKWVKILPNYVDKNCNITVGNYNALMAITSDPNAAQYIDNLKTPLTESQVMKMCLRK